MGATVSHEDNESTGSSLSSLLPSLEVQNQPSMQSSEEMRSWLTEGYKMSHWEKDTLDLFVFQLLSLGYCSVGF